MKNRVVQITLFLSVAITILVSSNLNWNKRNWNGILEADARGYYSYLPAIFIYQDLNYGFFDKIEGDKYYDEHYYYDYRMYQGDKCYNKCYVGTAVVQTPFFLLAHAITSIKGGDADGYSILYPIFINVAALFYLYLGIFFLNKSLRVFEINKLNRAITIVATIFGTHLFYYAIVEPGMSHVYSFAFFNLFIYYSLQYFQRLEGKLIVILGALLGIIMIIRPVNILIVLSLPFLSRSKEQFAKGIRNLWEKITYTILGSLTFGLIIFLQLLVYKIATGSFFVYSYGEEGFDFSNPNIINILFSYKKGLFLYTPMLLLALIGGYYIWNKSKYQLLGWFLFMFIVTYIFSSWWMWYYGGSFSSRVYIEFIPFFMILMGTALQGLKTGWKKKIYYTFIGVLLIICQIQTYQYRYNQIHWSEMNKEKYWDVFLRIDRLI